jgi:hypothetical protein
VKAHQCARARVVRSAPSALDGAARDPSMPSWEARWCDGSIGPVVRVGARGDLRMGEAVDAGQRGLPLARGETPRGVSDTPRGTRSALWRRNQTGIGPL